MNDELSRELTTLEYTILGLLSITPLTGYSVIGALEKGSYRLSTSTGSIYPALKRLERHNVIAGELEAVYETRPRKVYKLTPLGGELLDAWLREPLSLSEILEERDIALTKFLFLEKRVSREEVLAWLDAFEKATDSYDATHRIWYDVQMDVSSVHQQLVIEASMMELNMQRAWIKLARERLAGTA
jgi:DNA-binding PadR family transcriptional regulator